MCEAGGRGGGDGLTRCSRGRAQEEVHANRLPSVRFVTLLKTRGNTAARMQAALQHDKKNYNVFLLIGKAAFKLGEFAQSELAYRKAIEVDSEKALAWQGLLEIFAHLADNEKSVEPLKVA
eukprot:4015525-Pyramimonas_sp.AAC.1